MRRSVSAVALIRREERGERCWLAQWNKRWRRFFLVGGHKEAGESFRECLVREIREELGLRDGRHLQVSPAPLGTLRYTAWSEGAQARTRYHLAGFEVHLLKGDALRKVNARQSNRWLSEREVVEGRTFDDRPVSDTMARVLKELNLLGGDAAVRRPAERFHIAWSAQAAASLASVQQKARLEAELRRAVQDEHPDELVVLSRLEGYSRKSNDRVVLAVELKVDSVYRAYIVKLGSGSEFPREYAAWQKNVVGQGVRSRFLVPLKGVPLPPEAGQHRRFALLYQNANSSYGEGRQSPPALLEEAVSRSVKCDEPTTGSVERVLSQIHSDFHIWFYRKSREDPVAALRFYRRRIRKARDRWYEDPWRVELRRDALWLFSGMDKPDGETPATYLDPFEYVPWALDRAALPPTLVGRSHGDLHGRNILVGFERRETEHPSVFDYGEMSHANVIAWDFVKLETELKVRLLLELQANARARAAFQRETGWVPGPSCPPEARATQDRCAQLRFAFWFENHLAEMTAGITGTSGAERQVDSPDSLFPESPEVGRALAILVRVRKEAALFLGYRHGQKRGAKWREEYYFALAVYGLCTAKWDNYEPPHSVCALVSAGVASARLASAQEEILRRVAARRAGAGPFPSYRIPLAHAHRLWMSGRREKIHEARRLLEGLDLELEYAIPVLREYALILAELRRPREALVLIDHLRPLCPVFGDYRTLSRMGRIFKNYGDRMLEKHRVPLAQLKDRPAGQYYDKALQLYKEAFAVRSSYYPGVNVCTLGLLLGDRRAKALATKVHDICQTQRIGVPRDDRFWMLASAGEASLVAGESEQAAKDYRAALRNLDSSGKQMAQSAYNQVCRLWFALGRRRVAPVVREFTRSALWPMRPGPLGDCDMATRSRRKGRRP